MGLAPQESRTYFVTTVTAQRRRLFQVTETAKLLQQTLLGYRDQGKFALHAYVIMPDHVHLLLTPAYDVSLERALQLIKGGFSFRLKSKLDVWERSFNERQVKTATDFAAFVTYIEMNPVRARMVETAGDFAHSSAGHRGLVDQAPVHLRG
jgi:putative transposase